MTSLSKPFAAPLLALLLALPSLSARADDESTRVRIVLTDVTNEAGLAQVKGDRFSFGDYDADGDPDLLVNGKTLLRNDGGTFVDVAKDSGIQAGPGGGACWVDLDRDGDLDVVTLHGGVKIQVAKGRFENRAKAWGVTLAKRPTALGVGDVDGDGFPDLLFGGGEKWNDGNAEFFPRRLFRNQEGKRFEDVSKDHELEGGRYGRAVVFADYDRDFDLDVYLGNYRLMANELLRNHRGRLGNVAKAAGVEGKYSDDRGEAGGKKWGYRYGHTIASSWADLDADGDLDLWVSNLAHKYAGPTRGGGFDVRGWLCDDSPIYENEGPPHWRFTDRRPESGIPLQPTGGASVYDEEELWSHAAIADLDLDGLPEVFVTQVYKLDYSHSLLFHNRGNFRFEEISGDVGVKRFDSYGGAFADIDGDGDVDLVTNGRAAGSDDAPREVKLYRNDTEPGPWIGFRVWGRKGEIDPIGVQVVCVFEDGRAVRQVEGGMGSHTQQNESVLRFGLRGRELKEVWVRWPDGVVQRLKKPKVGEVQELRYPKAKIPELRVDEPAYQEEDNQVLYRARATAALSWKFRYDLDQDGVFETVSKNGKALVEAFTPVEVRVRLWHERKGLGREAVFPHETLGAR